MDKCSSSGDSEDIRIYFRNLERRDVDLLWAWRQIPQVIQYLPSTPRPLLWETHRLWFDKAIKQQGSKRTDLIVCQRWTNRILAHVHASDLDASYPEVGVVVGAIDMHNHHVGRRAIEYLLGVIRPGHAGAVALIALGNEASVRMFESIGFKNTSSFGRSNQVVYERRF